ncbi:MAG: protein kinase [Candidatus Eisenbacteria bacterium]|nr:protein kinase [Candidatus Eisenbacteria bacterium]
MTPAKRSGSERPRSRDHAPRSGCKPDRIGALWGRVRARVRARKRRTRVARWGWIRALGRRDASLGRDAAVMIGKQIAQYRILEKLGAGGLGVVYKAEDTKLERIVALKFLRPEVVGEEEHHIRFLREARSAAALDHPNICTVHEIGEVSGEVFIAMAFIDGVGLDERIRRGPLPIDEATGIAVQVADALREAHDRGLIHRDIKSANVRMTPRGQAKLLDFGLAKRSGEAELTQAGTIMGTVACMSPEQARGEEADHRTDIWALGVMLYEMVAGELPFRAENPAAVLHAILHDEPEPLSATRKDVPPEFERIIARSLAKDPAERYQQIDEMLEDLRSLLGTAGRDSTTTVIMTSGDGGSAANLGFWRKLWARRAPQAMAVYALASAAVVLLLRWLVERYPISPRLPDFALVLFACLLPSVFLLAYSRSRGTQEPRPSRDLRVPWIGVPANVIVAAGLLLLLFQGQQLGAATTRISLQTEDGGTITREVPRREFRKRIAVFAFDGSVPDSTHDWLGHGVVQAIAVDLSQDPYVHVEAGFPRRARDAGFPDGRGLPWGLKREIAEQQHFRHFLSGAYRVENDTLVIQSELYETSSGELLARRSFHGALELTLIDSLTVQLKRDLGIPAYHMAQTQDLLLTTLLTESLPAAREAMEGSFAWRFANDYPAAEAHFSRAVELDPTFAWAHLFLGVAHAGQGQSLKAQAALRQALKHDYKLPETYRFMLRAQYQYARQDFRAGLAAAQNWARLQPQSIEAHSLLAIGYVYANQPDAAIAELEAMRELDPERYDLLLEIGELHQDTGRLDEALGYYEEYAERFPEDAGAHMSIAAVHRERGEFDQAKHHYETARVLEPGRIATLRRIAELEVLLGNYEKAEAQLLGAMSQAETPEDRGRILQSLAVFYTRRGQIAQAIEYSEAFVETFKRIGAPAQATALKLTIPSLLARVGRAEEALARLEALSREDVFAAPGSHWFLALGYLGVYTTLEDPTYLGDAREVLDQAQVGVEESGFEMLAMPVILAGGWLLMMEENYRQAAAEFERCLEISYPDEQARREAYVGLARCYRNLRELDRAQLWIRRVLDADPREPTALAEAARIAWARGDREEARATMRRALEVWEVADPGLLSAARARKDLAEWDEPS